MDANMTFRMDSDIKAQMISICNKLGMTPSTAFNIFANAFVREQGIPFKDKSGERLREWLGVDSDFFYNSKLISVLPLDFYYPGKGKSGDLPPRLECADKWHKLLISNMPNIELIILIGFYAQKYYLGNKVKKNLTETVKNYKIYLPKYIPLVHPSPLNFRWFNRNPWFEENISFLKQRVKEIIGGNK